MSVRAQVCETADAEGKGLATTPHEVSHNIFPVRPPSQVGALRSQETRRKSKTTNILTCLILHGTSKYSIV